MGPEFKLPAFEGPLDLLLHLIGKNKIDIYDIPIAEITDQYLAYLADMEEVDLDVMSDFLLMAATLLDIKAAMLLPDDEQEPEEEEEDPRAALVERLIEYRRYKLLSGELQDISVGSDRMLFRPESLPPEVADYRPPVDLSAMLEGIDADLLRRIFENAVKLAESRSMAADRRIADEITREVIPIETGIRNVRNTLKRSKTKSLRGLLRSLRTRDEVIVTFLAVLELLKTGDLTLMGTDDEDYIIEVNNADEE